MDATLNNTAVCPEEAYILFLIWSVWKNRCVAVILNFKIPELLCNTDKESISIDEIASKSGCQSSVQLYVVMKVLAHCGIGKELENKHFTKNKSMELLRRDQGSSLGHFFYYLSCDEHFSALRSLGGCLKTGERAFSIEHGMTHMDYLCDFETKYQANKMFDGLSTHRIGSDERREELSQVYKDAMTYCTKLELLPGVCDVKTPLNGFPWSTCGTLVDVGGCSGSFLASILSLPSCEHVQGYVVDLPNVVEQAKASFDELNVPDHRIQFISHNILEPFDGTTTINGDTVLFKCVLSMFVHDDITIKKIMSNCRSLLSSEGGRLIVMDYMAPDGCDKSIGINGSDPITESIHRLVIDGKPHLSKTEWTQILDLIGGEFGYKVERSHDTFYGGVSILELSYRPA